MRGMSNPAKELFGLFVEEIEVILTALSIEKYRAKQIAVWMYSKDVFGFNEMLNLPVPMRAKLSELCRISVPVEKSVRRSKDGRTSKFLLGFDSDSAVETVLLRQPYGQSVCVSSQVGCAMGCLFCASTISGCKRNLTAGEMLSQVLHSRRVSGEKIGSIVVMGSGEPLLNYDELIKFIRLCHEPYSLNLGYRNFTVSTCGIVPGIDRLAAEMLPINLSISLHAPNNEIRSTLMPINKKHPMADVLSAAERYVDATGRRVTYEYTLIADVNDSDEHARELASLLRGRLSHVNLIPVNPIAESGMAKTDMRQVEKFESILMARKIPVSIRREMGADIQAACGQLRREVETL